MTKAALLAEIMQLPLEERRQLLEEAWQQSDAEELSPLTPGQIAEYERRLALHDADPSRAAPWDEVRARLWSRFK